MDIGLLIFGIIIVVNLIRFFKKAAEGYNSASPRVETVETPSVHVNPQDEGGEGVTHEWREVDRQPTVESRPVTTYTPSMLSTGRRPQTPPKAPVTASPQLQQHHPLLGSKQDVARALVLGEILGEPRAKRPWGPRSTRK